MIPAGSRGPGPRGLRGLLGRQAPLGPGGRRGRRGRRRAVALVAVAAAVVVALLFGAAPSRPGAPAATTVPGPLATSPGIGAARQSCTLFASLVSDLQAGKVGPGGLSSRVAAVDRQAAAAASADGATFTKLAADARALDSAVGANDPATGRAAQALATDCQGILGTAPSKT